MRTRTSLRLVIAAVALSVPMLGSATGLGFLNNTPLSFFTQQDFQLMRAAVKAVLEDPDPMTVREWLNPANQYSGKIEGLGAFKTSDGLPCRKLRVSTQARGIESAATYPVCRTAGDEWQLASGKELIRDAAAHHDDTDLRRRR